ncbi:hypothetical protein ATCC90586_003906 [Pythium insidiosum]|nr:hypothetical protein ATCC90586_003906 [Pythium insidiosum]
MPAMTVPTKTPPGAARESGSGASRDCSAQLETLLNAWGGVPGAGPAYDAEAMIDELLASVWDPAPRRRSATGAGGAAASRVESFTQQTRSMNALQGVLADAIDRLLRHRQVVSDRIAALERDNRQVAGAFHGSLAGPEQLLSAICSQLEDLEERFTKVSSTAVVIGDKLSALERERARVLDTDEMMEALLALNDPAAATTRSANRLYNVLQDKTQLHEAARVIQRMVVFASELTSPSMAVAVAEIERLSQTIESDLLAEFSDAQERRQDRAMRQCAASLIEYRDRDKIADRYVWNVMKDRLAKDDAGDAAAGSLDPLQDLESLFDKIDAVCRDEFAVIARVFPSDAACSLRELLVERLFSDPAFGILSYLEQLLSPRSPSASVASASEAASPGGSASAEYVRLLCAAYERACALAAKIEAIELPSASRPALAPTAAPFSPLSEATEAAATDAHSSSSSSSSSSDRERMHAFLQLQLHSLFGSHRQRYVRTELDLLQRQFKELLAGLRWPQPPVVSKKAAAASKAASKAAAADKSGLPPTPVASASASTAPTPTAVTATAVAVPPSSSSTSIERDAAMPSTAEPTVASTASYVETLTAIAQDEDLPALFADEMQAALTRCGVILKDSEMRGELVTKLFSTFCAAYGEELLGKLVALTTELLNEPLLTTDSATQFFTVLEHLLRRIEFIDEQFDSLIAPAQHDSPTQLTICFESKRKCLERLERSLSAGLQLVLSVVDKQVAAVLATTQDKSDFIGSDANLSLSSSRACKRCADVLTPLVALVARVLRDDNRDAFLVALVGVLRELLLQHLQRFRFDPDGACMLLRDVNAYRQIFAGHRHAAIDDAFDLLHEVANLFALPPENVGSFIRDGKLAAMSKAQLSDLVKRRWDYKTHADKIQAQL